MTYHKNTIAFWGTHPTARLFLFRASTWAEYRPRLGMWDVFLRDGMIKAGRRFPRHVARCPDLFTAISVAHNMVWYIDQLPENATAQLQFNDRYPE